MKNNKLPFSGKDLPINEQQTVWVDGLLAGFSQQSNIQKEFDEDTNIGLPITILYGTQTGNAESVAYQCAEQAKEHGLSAHVLDMGDVSFNDVVAIERLLIITSTYGEGEMPDNAEDLWQEALSSDANLANTYFSVLSLGDSAYDLFCEAGKLWDAQLEKLGANRVADRVDCDVDFDQKASDWMNQVLPIISQKGSQKISDIPKEKSSKPKSQFSRKNPLMATLVNKQVLTTPQSSKEIVHFEFDLGDSKESYKVGAILNVIPKNQSVLVNELLSILKAKGDDVVMWQGDSIALKTLFTEKLDIRNPSLDLVSAIAERASDTRLSLLLDQKEELEKFLYGKDIVDLLIRYDNTGFNANVLIAYLKPLSPRAYSISSSINKYENQVHLTIGSVRYEHSERTHLGVCSTWLADCVDEGDLVPCYFSPNKYFTVPEDNEKPMIMVGPGTGIAPFKAFLEEREARLLSGEKMGDNWLFFGDREKQNDFIYKEQLQDWQQSGLLTRLDLAFSRDQAEKIYVQTKMQEQGKVLFDWLEKGAYFYVCGDAYRMAKDVDKTLHEIIAEHGSLTEDQAKDYIDTLKKQKRYVRDVY